ncbi:MAG: ABC transporter permease [Armatimonadetes bacterium]|nr:ABC transporter permease [Armatimonadota bacterium]MBS1726850.1 ABC transporter permease [Armatimonadota bacterium]
MKREFGLVIVLIVLFGVCHWAQPRFTDPRNLNSILLWMPLLLVAAVGQFPVIVARGIDISIGSILGLSAISVGVLLKSNPHLPVPALFVIGALVGLLLGCLNGLVIAFGKVPAVVATIGTLTAFRGLTFVLSQGEQVNSTAVPDSLTKLASKGIDIGQVTLSWLLVIGLLVAAIAWFAARYLQFYRDIFAYGSNPDAAYLRGISPKTVQMIGYGASGLLSGVAGTMYLARFGTANPGSVGSGFELIVIAAVAIGGVKITGGSGSIPGVILGCLLLASINVALVVLGIDANWQTLVYGATILIALIIDTLSNRRRALA